MHSAKPRHSISVLFFPLPFLFSAFRIALVRHPLSYHAFYHPNLITTSPPVACEPYKQSTYNINVMMCEFLRMDSPPSVEMTVDM